MESEQQQQQQQRKRSGQCQYLNCTTNARTPTLFCKKHGGGKRCQFPLCEKSAREPTIFCTGHNRGDMLDVLAVYAEIMLF